MRWKWAILKRKTEGKKKKTKAFYKTLGKIM